MILFRGRLSLLLCAAFAVAAGPAAALHREQALGPARLDVAAATSDDSLALADTLTLTLTVESGPGLEVDPSRDRPGSPQWTLLQRSKPVTDSLPDGRRRWKQTLVLAPLTTGKLTLMPPSLRYRDAANDWKSADWQPLVIAVTTEIAQPDVAKLRDVTNVETVPPSTEAESSPWPWLASGAILVALVAGFVALVRRRRDAARVPALEALRELKRLDARRMPEQHRGELFVTLLSLILRRYLERHFQLPARRRTTAEFIDSLADCPCFTSSQRDFLVEFLRRSDLVKFANASPSMAECAALASGVRGFIEETSRAIVTPR